jgi:3-oxoacyl-[acyl-carrier protein] reductase
LHYDLAGKVALVTGGSRGIGAAVARALAGAGADVAITYLNSRQAAENVAAEMRAMGVRARSVQADQADPAAAAAVVRQVAGELGRVDILVNNAAVAVLGPALTCGFTGWLGGGLTPSRSAGSGPRAGGRLRAARWSAR